MLQKNHELSKREFLNNINDYFVEKYTEQMIEDIYDEEISSDEIIQAHLENLAESGDLILADYENHPFHLLVHIPTKNVNIEEIQYYFKTALSLGFPFFKHKVNGFTAFELSSIEQNEITSQIFIGYISSCATGIRKF